MQTNYIILFWIIALVIFTFYCIYRLYIWMPENNSSYNSLSNPLSNPLSESLINITKPNSFIQYIDDAQSHNKITDIPECAKIFDDNVAVRSLGYNNCASAYSDYIARNLDINNAYGNTNTLAKLCPITTHSNTYMNCMQQLLNKFNTNANIVSAVNVDMTNLLNKRLIDRSDVLNNVELEINPYLFNSSQMDFYNNVTLGEPLTPTPDQILANVNSYYQNKYSSSKSIFNNITNDQQSAQSAQLPHNPANYEEHFANQDIYNIDPYIENNFLGLFTPIKGQYLAFNNLTVILNYEILPTVPAIISATMPATNQDLPKKIFLTIIDNNTNAQIIYEISNIDFYLQYKNVIKLDLLNQTINTINSTDSQALQQLLIIMGFTVPTKLIMTIDEFTSTENITRQTYKLLNINMNTIMIMEKNK